MARWTPDPSFYPSPAAAAGAPPETVAYVATLNVASNGDARPDALTVLDLEPGSPTYGQLVGRLDMPNVGDELHHFGWNACSSALCPWAPHPHVERRYLLVPGPALVAHPRRRRQGRPARAADHQGHRGRGDRRQGGLQPPAHGPLRARRHLRLRARQRPTATRRAASSCSTTTSFAVKGRWEVDRGPQELAYDFWWHLNQGTVITSEWGTPNMVEDGLVGELLLGNQYGHKLHIWDLDKRSPRPGDRPRCRAPDGARAAPRARSLQGVRLRRRGHLDRRPVGVRVAVDTRRRRHGERREGDHDPGRAGRGGPAAGAAQALRRGAAAGHRHLALGRRPLPARLLLGHRRAQALRRRRSAGAARDRLGPARRHRAAARRTRLPGRSTAGRRWSRSRATASGCTSPTRSTRRGTRSSTPRASTAGWSSSTRPTTAACRSTPDVFVSYSGERPHQIRLGGGDASSDSYCFPDS